MPLSLPWRSSNVKIVLKSDVPNLGVAGDVTDVAPGYARNYLIPQGLAVPATASALQQSEQLRSASTRRDERLAAQAAELAKRLGETTLTFEAKAGEKGRLYGSVTTAEIADALSQEIGETFDRRKHILGDPIRHVGEHLVPVRLTAEVTASVKVLVKPADGERAEEAEAPAEGEAASEQPTTGDAEATPEAESDADREAERRQQEA
jgi:large subunit ribosomal protein L9